MRFTRENTDTVVFYLFIYILWQVGSTLTVFYGNYIFPQHSTFRFINVVFLSPIAEELFFRIVPLALGPLLLITYQNKRRTTVKNILVLLLLLFNVLTFMLDIVVIGFLVTDILTLVLLTAILFSLELVYCLVIIPRMHEKGYLVVIVLSSVLFGSGHYSYSIYYTIPVTIFGLLISYYYINRTQVLKWRELTGEELTKNVCLASAYILVLHALNNFIVYINFVSNVRFNNVLQDIILIVLFYVVMKLTVKPLTNVQFKDQLGVMPPSII